MTDNALSKVKSAEENASKIIEEANKNKSFFRNEILTLLRPLSYIILGDRRI